MERILRNLKNGMKEILEKFLRKIVMEKQSYLRKLLKSLEALLLRMAKSMNNFPKNVASI